MFGDIETDQMVFGCSERLHVNVKKGYAIFHGKFLSTPKVLGFEFVMLANHDKT